MTGDLIQSEFAFELPHGYPDEDGTLHREGVMRLATAADEIKPLTDPRVKSNPSYLSVILLARVTTSLGSLADDDVTSAVVENLYVQDLAYLQDLYTRLNERRADVTEAACPDCGAQFQTSVSHGGSGVSDPEAQTTPAPDVGPTVTDGGGAVHGGPEGNPEP
jgi:hypothetical protein